MADATIIEISTATIKHVVGLDTASNRWHAYRNDGCTWSAVMADKKASIDDKRQYLYTQAKMVFGLQPAGTLIVCEEPIAAKNGMTTRVLGLAAGAIWAAHLECDISWFWADIAAWKRMVIGKGNADKDMIAAWVRENMKQEWTKKNDADFYDAAALCRYGELLLGWEPVNADA